MTQLLVVKLDLNGVQGGRSERYYVDAGNTPDPVQKIELAKSIVYGRSAFFGSDVQCVYARVSRIGPPPDKETVPLPYPIGPHSAWGTGGGPGDTLGPVNDDNIALFQCFQLVGSKWANHYFNFVPDSWVTSMRLAPGLLPYMTPAPDTGAVTIGASWGGSHLQLCQAFWRLLIQQTVSGKKVTSTNYTPTAIRDIIYRGVTRHNVGRFFGQHRGRRPTTLIS